MPEADSLSDRDRAILAFEEARPRHSGAKEAAIRNTFHFNATRYYQVLNRLVRTPAAIAAYPMVCSRVQKSIARAVKLRAARISAPHER